MLVFDASLCVATTAQCFGTVVGGRAMADKPRSKIKKPRVGLKTGKASSRSSTAPHNVKSAALMANESPRPEGDSGAKKTSNNQSPAPGGAKRPTTGSAPSRLFAHSVASIFTEGEYYEALYEVRLGEGAIVVSYFDDEGAVIYRGTEVEPGHFKLEAPERNGRGTLHRFKDSIFLEGFWQEGGSLGMWRIQLEAEL
jgi:hypothetical protein